VLCTVLCPDSLPFCRNVKAVFFLTQALASALEEAAKRSKSRSSIISVGSIAGLGNQPFPTYSYDASKSAVHHLTRHFAASFASRNITANSIAPGLVPSKVMIACLLLCATVINHHFQQMSKQLLTYSTADQLLEGIPLGRQGIPSDMAGLCIYFASKAGEWVTGQTTAVDGGAVVSGHSSGKAKSKL
jgi:NAD(P)-dependent dehydrogenase (short-subunit alcohol dehydrogenase family)